MAEIVLDRVSKRYAGARAGEWAVRDLSWQVQAGQRVALVGPSGCGKTTTLRLIAGLESPTSGQIGISGRVVNRAQPGERGVGMVFQDSALYAHLSVRANLAFGLRQRRMARAEIARRLADVAAMLDISELLDRRPGTLSGGQRQRAALAKAMVIEPACLLLDEPLSDLDAALRAQLRGELLSLHSRRPTTTIYVTHDQEEAMTLGQRVAVMSRGTLQQMGTPREVYDQPVNRFVAAFIGSSPMNFIEGRLTRADGHVGFEARAGFRMPIPGEGAQRLEEHIDREAVLGVRPAQVVPAQAGAASAGGVQLQVDVESVEWLGDEVRLRGTCAAGTSIVAIAGPDRPHPSLGRQTFQINPRATHLFEPGEFGRRIV